MASYELFSVKNYENASNNFIKNSSKYIRIFYFYEINENNNKIK